MINQALLIFSLIAVYEFLTYVKFKQILRSNLTIYQKLYNIILNSKLSDDKKEKKIIEYSKNLLMISFKIIFIISIIIFFCFGLDIISDSFIKLLTSLLGITECLLFFIVYNLIRK